MHPTADTLERELGRSDGERERTPVALERAYLTFAHEVRVWIRARGGARLRLVFDVDDVDQEVWLRVTQSYSSFDPQRGSLRSWVFGITQHTLFDLLRRQRAAPVSLDDPADGTLDTLAFELGSEREVCPNQGLPEPFLKELATLSAADGDLLRICALEGRSTIDAAHELSISASAARKRWLRLRRRLAQRTYLVAQR